MRIRKRFPYSSPLSDPQLNRSPVVQQTCLQLHPNGNIRVQEAKSDSQPSDPPNQPPLRPLPSEQQTIIAGERSKRILISDHELKIKQKQGEKERGTEKQDQEHGCNNPRKESILLGVAIAHTGLLPPSSSHQVALYVVDERWYEGDKAIPLKKRRGSFVGRMGEETLMLKNEKKMKPKMKSKTNKKCSSVLQNSDEQEKESYSTTTNNNVVKKKMNKRGSVIMEGSRCNRVNGRGWRCCQQTLVGYSLCEHHLGKGRLRSITSIRSRAMGASITTITTSTIAPQPHHDIKFERLSSVSSSSSSLVQSSRDEEILLDDSYDDDDDDNDDDDYDDDEKKKKPVLVRKKRMKLGMVKARSLSSLLDQTNNAVVVAAGDWNN